MTHILDQEAFGLADSLKPLSVEQRRRIVAKACELAAATLRDVPPDVRALLLSVATRNRLDRQEVDKARALAEAADERYLTIREEGGDRAVWIQYFYTTCLLTALWNAFAGETWSDAADAIYELSKTRDDPSEILSFVREAVRLAAST